MEGMGAIADAVDNALEIGATTEEVIKAVVTGAMHAAWMRNGGDEEYDAACGVIASLIGMPTAQVVVPIRDPDSKAYTKPEINVYASSLGLAHTALDADQVVQLWKSRWGQ